MQLVIKDGIAIAMHDDFQSIDPAIYGEGASNIFVPDGTAVNLMEPFAPTVDQAEYNLKQKREQALNETDWLAKRHRDQKELVSAGKLGATTLTDAQYLSVLEYQQAWRDLPKAEGFPLAMALPTPPEGV